MACMEGTEVGSNGTEGIGVGSNGMEGIEVGSKGTKGIEVGQEGWECREGMQRASMGAEDFQVVLQEAPFSFERCCNMFAGFHIISQWENIWQLRNT